MINGNARTTVTLGLLMAALLATKSFAAPPSDPKSCEPGAMSRVDPSIGQPGTKDPGKNEPSTTGSGQNENLSDRPPRSDGVFSPQTVALKMPAPPPGGGKPP